MTERLKKGWARVTLGDVVANCRDQVQDREAAGIERIIGLDDLISGDLRIQSWKPINESPSFKTHFKPGQTLFGKRRAYLRKVAFADFEGVCTQNILVLESKDHKILIPELLPFLCSTDAFYEYVISTSEGSLFPNANWNAMAEFEFALPPLEEQWRITHAIQAALGVIEQLQESSRLLGVTAESLINKDTNNEFKKFPMASKSLGELAEITKLAGFEYTKYVKYRPDGEIIAIRPLNIKNGRLVLDDIQTIDKETSDMLPRSKVKKGDVLITYIGEYVGEVLLIEEDDKYHLAPNIARITSFGEIMPRLLERLLRGSVLQGQIVSYTTTTATPSLTMSALRKLQVCYPTNIDDQRWLVEKINAVDSSSELLGRRLSLARELLTRLIAQTLNGGAE